MTDIKVKYTGNANNDKDIPIKCCKDGSMAAGVVRVLSRFIIKVTMTEPYPGVVFTLMSREKGLAAWNQLSKYGRSAAEDILVRIERAGKILARQRTETEKHLERFMEARILEESRKEKLKQAEELLENSHDTDERIRLCAEINDNCMTTKIEYEYINGLWKYVQDIVGVIRDRKSCYIYNDSCHLLARYALEQVISTEDLKGENRHDRA
ncbi:MAG TPA: hypothetical protein P5295_13700 [Spirochaetota bacterium]|nr:hypothetical protein [Spirochaetota bacterium]